MSIRDDIYNYELKLSELKKELNNLSKVYLSNPKSNTKFLSSKIESMQNEIQAINYQLNLFRTSISDVQPAETAQIKSEEAPKIPVVENSYEKPRPINTYTSETVHIPNDYIQNSSVSNRKTETKDLENTIGKSFMGILASILIFISFILFAKLLYPLLTNAIKIIAMYLISSAFTLFGLFKLKNDSKNKLYLSITGCGVGALYISLILSNIYFKVIGDITLYLLILAWAIFTAYLSRLRSTLFGTIGQAGISIALIFGNILCSETNDINKFFVLNIFFVITAFLFNTSRIYRKNLANNIFNIFNLSIMTACYFEFSNTYNLSSLNGNLLFVDIIPFILLAFTLYKLVTAYTLFKLNGKNIDFCIINHIYLIILLNILYDLIPSTNIFNIISFIIFTLLLIINEIKFKNNNCIGRIIFQVILMIWLTQNCFALNFVDDYIGLSILAIPFIIYGFYAKDNLFKYAGLIAFTIYVCQFDLYGIFHFIIGLIIFALLAYLTLKEKEQYSSIIKIITYLLFLYFGASYLDDLFGINFEASEVAIFMFLSITNLIAAKSAFKNNFVTGETEDSTLITTQIINVILMIWSLNLIGDSTDYSAIVHTLIIFISLALFVANTRNLLKKYDGLGAGIYIGIKFTILMLVILNAWEASSFAISISCLLFAILGIVLGFYFKQKSFRIYGLGLTMISTVKLIMIDIAYENSIGHALSFFVSGILCFAISAIYNLIDKKFLKEDSDEE